MIPSGILPGIPSVGISSGNYPSIPLGFLPEIPEEIISQMKSLAIPPIPLRIPLGIFQGFPPVTPEGFHSL